MNAKNIAIVGATGAVGVEILRVLERRNFPVASLKLLASARSVGKTLEFKGKPYKVEELKADAFKGVDIAFFSAGATRSREFVPGRQGGGLRRRRQLLGLPHGPRHAAGRARGERRRSRQAQRRRRQPQLHRRHPVGRRVADPPGRRREAHHRVDLSVGLGRGRGPPCRSWRTRGGPATSRRARRSSARSSRTRSPSTCSLHNTKVAENGYNEERTRSSSKRRARCSICLSCRSRPTCIPRAGAARALRIDHARAREAAVARRGARHPCQAPGVKVVDDAANNHFPMPLEASGDLDVHVGRIRRDLSNPNGLMLWVAGDQLLKGAAWNAVQIAEELAKLSAKPERWRRSRSVGWRPYASPGAVDYSANAVRARTGIQSLHEIPRHDPRRPGRCHAYRRSSLQRSASGSPSVRVEKPEMTAFCTACSEVGPAWFHTKSIWIVSPSPYKRLLP